jgi:hypothetical protein
MFHLDVASRDLSLKTDHYQDIYFALSNMATISLNTSLESRHPLEENPTQARLLTSAQNHLNSRSKIIPRLERRSSQQHFHMPEQTEVGRSQIR